MIRKLHIAVFAAIIFFAALGVLIRNAPQDVQTREAAANHSGADRSVIGLPILMYHFFYDKSAGEMGKDNNWMEISDFEKQMKYLHDNDYYYPTWDEVSDFIDGIIELPEKSVVVTIDGGAASFFKLAVPLFLDSGLLFYP